MDPLILYPSQDRLKVAMMVAAVLVAMPFVLNLSGLGGFIPFFPMIAMAALGGGVVLFINVMKMKRSNNPVFAADAMGFSIRGGRKLDWDEFKGANTMPFDTAIKIGTGESKLRPNVEIKALELSGPAREMVSQIEEYAAKARLAAVMGGAVTLGAKRVSREDAMPPTLEEVSGFGAVANSASEKSREGLFQKGAPSAAPMVGPDGGLLPLELFPNDASRLKGFAASLVALFIAYKLASRTDVGDVIWAAWFLGGLGVFGLTVSIWSYLRPKPSFTADIDGFSVRGKRKKSWDEFRSVGVHTVSYWFIPVARNVVIKTGKSVLGGRQHIPNYLMNGSAKDMTAEISQYVRAVQFERQKGSANVMRKAEAVMAQGAQQAAPRQAVRAASAQPKFQKPTAQPIYKADMPKGDPFLERLQKGNTPVSKVPTFGERIFGTRKVF